MVGKVGDTLARWERLTWGNSNYRKKRLLTRPKGRHSSSCWTVEQQYVGDALVHPHAMVLRYGMSHTDYFLVQ